MKRFVLTAGLIFFAWGMIGVHAAEITWDYPRNISATNDMPAGLSVVDAYNAGGTAVDWEGVHFSATTTNFGFSSGNKYTGYLEGLPFPRIDSAKEQLMKSGRWNLDSITISNLTPGVSYVVQIWISDSRYYKRFDEDTLSDAAGHSVTLRVNTYRKSGGLGQYVLGKFTADATTQTISLSAKSHVNAIVLYVGDIVFGPPPSNTMPNESALIDWSVPRNIAGSTDFLLLKPVAALNVGGSRTIRLQAITFAADDGSSSIEVSGPKTSSGLVPGTASSLDPVISQEYADLLDAGATNAYSILLTGLENGKQYTVQVWVNDARTNGIGRSTLVDDLDNELAHNVQNRENALGQYIIGTFTANGGTQAIALGKDAFVNAIVVYEGKPMAHPPRLDDVAVHDITDRNDFLKGLTLVRAVNAGANEAVTIRSNLTFVADDGSVRGNKYTNFGEPEWYWENTYSNYAKLIRSGRWAATEINLSGLTPGKVYTLQVWANDSRSLGLNRKTEILFPGNRRALLQQQVTPIRSAVGQFVTCVFTAQTSTVTLPLDGYENGVEGSYAVISAYALYEGATDTAGELIAWAKEHGLEGWQVLPDADADGDGVDNLTEYAQGGDPADPVDHGTAAVLERDGGSVVQLIHPIREADTNLFYTVYVNDDLLYGYWRLDRTWKPNGASNWFSATNRFPIDTSAKYFALRVSRNACAEISVFPDRVIRVIDRHQMLSENIAMWYPVARFTDSTLISYLQDAGVGGLRMPGGSWSDTIFWNGNGVRNGNTIDTSKYSNYQWDIDYSAWAPGFRARFIPGDPDTPELLWNPATTVKDMHEFITAVGCSAMVTVNAGTGNATLAKEWVRWANKTQGYNVEYWEVGNELMGGWESGHIRPDGTEMTGELYAEIFDEFATAMRSVDPSIKVGGPAGGFNTMEFVTNFLANVTTRVDFVSIHFYPRNPYYDDSEGWARAGEQVAVGAREVREYLRQYFPDRADDIEIHLTEHNVHGQGTETVTRDFGVWTAVSIGEMLNGEVDRCFFWDSLTANSDSGTGHGFMVSRSNGYLRKPQYWTFYLYHHYFGNNIVACSDADSVLRTYAATDDDGHLYVLVVNPSPDQTRYASINIGGVDAEKYNSVKYAVFSEMEYFWDMANYRPLWSGPPTERNLAQGRVGCFGFLPSSITAFIFSQISGAETVEVEGGTEALFPSQTRNYLRLHLINADGSPAVGSVVEISSDDQCVEPAATRYITDEKGEVNLSLSAYDPGTDTLHITARFTNGVEVNLDHPVVVKDPQLRLATPDGAERGRMFDMVFHQIFGTNDTAYGTPIPIDEPLDIIVTDSDGNASRTVFNHGVAAFRWQAPDSTGTETFTVEVPHYGWRFPLDIEIYEPLIATNLLSDLSSLSGFSAGTIDDSTFAGESVLAYTPPSASATLKVSLYNVPHVDTEFYPIQQKMIGFVVDLYIPSSASVPSGASFAWSITSGWRTWEGDEVDLSSLPRDTWNTVACRIPWDDQPDYELISKVSMLFSDIASQKIYIDNFRAIYKERP